MYNVQAIESCMKHSLIYLIGHIFRLENPMPSGMRLLPLWIILSARNGCLTFLWLSAKQHCETGTGVAFFFQPQLYCNCKPGTCELRYRVSFAFLSLAPQYLVL